MHDTMCNVPNSGGCFTPWCSCPCHDRAEHEYVDNIPVGATVQMPDGTVHTWTEDDRDTREAFAPFRASIREAMAELATEYAAKFAETEAAFRAALDANLGGHS